MIPNSSYIYKKTRSLTYSNHKYTVYMLHRLKLRHRSPMAFRTPTLIRLNSLLNHPTVQIRPYLHNCSTLIKSHAPGIGVVEFEPVFALRHSHEFHSRPLRPFPTSNHIPHHKLDARFLHDGSQPSERGLLEIFQICVASRTWMRAHNSPIDVWAHTLEDLGVVTSLHVLEDGLNLGA